MIFEYFSGKNLKTCRFVSKMWYDCVALTGRITIDTLYLSPREKDMEVFDAITHDSYLRRNIKHLVFDAAQFVKRSKDRYFESLCRQLADEHQRGQHSSNPGFQHLESLMLTPNPCDHEDFFQKCCNDPLFLEGFAQYHHLVEEQRNICSQSWFDRASHGLQRMVHLESVALRNTWDMLFFANPAFISGREVDDVEAQKRDLDAALVLLEKKGNTSQGRSPVARSWPPTALLPMARVDPWDDPKPTKSHYRRGGLSDGSLELLKLFEVLKVTRQQPSEMLLLSDWDGNGIPPIVFDIGWTSSDCFPTICGRLQILDIQLAPGDIRSLHGLQCLLQNTPALGRLSLKLPYSTEYAMDVFDYSHVFPGTGWRHPTLSSVNIAGLSATYRELAALLFVHIPQLEFLQLSYVDLADGKWEDFIEGLRNCDKLRNCQIKEPLTYPDRWYYWNVYTDWTTGPVDTWESEGHYRFLAALSQYINEGGRHPSLVDGEPNKASAKYMIKLDKTLRELRAAE